MNNLRPQRMISFFRTDMNRNSAARHEVAGDLHPARRASLPEIRQNPVHGFLMKRIEVPERKKIQLQRLAFNAEPVGHIPDHNMSEVGLVRDRTQAGEFGQSNVMT